MAVPLCCFICGCVSVTDSESVDGGDMDETGLFFQGELQGISGSECIGSQAFIASFPADVDMGSAVDYGIDIAIDAFQGSGVGDVGIDFCRIEVCESLCRRRTASDCDDIVFLSERETCDVISEESGSSGDDQSHAS